MNEMLLADLTKQIKELNHKLSKMNKEVFNARDAAEYLCIGYDTILRETRIGQMEHIKNGTSYIYKKEFLDRWLDKNKNKEVN